MLRLIGRGGIGVRLTPKFSKIEGAVPQWCNTLTLQPEQLGGISSIPGKDPPLERHDKGSRNRLVLCYFCDPTFTTKNRNFTFTLPSKWYIRLERLSVSIVYPKPDILSIFVFDWEIFSASKKFTESNQIFSAAGCQNCAVHLGASSR